MNDSRNSHLLTRRHSRSEENVEQKHLFNAQDNFDAEVDRAVAELNRLWRIHGTVMTDIEQVQIPYHHDGPAHGV